MRTIKFRIWDGSKMEYSVLAGAMGVVYVNPTNGGVNPRDTACITPFNTIYPDGIEVMQYTGLLDKNGKEIYEGDIILCEGKLVSICYNAPEFCMADNDWGYRFLSHPELYEVVGNIYDNKDLLEETK